MKLVVAGARGMLGRDLTAAAAAAGFDVAGFDLPEIDITREPSLAALPACDWVINCAAYTDVDGAEKSRELAAAVNAEGPRLLARWCNGHCAKLLHVSTDYVFHGDSTIPYREEALPRPLGVYGESKLAGERAVQGAGIDHLIVRTQALYGRNGRNFVDTIRSRLLAGQPLKVVNDQFVCPTWTVHLADGILRLLTSGHLGIVHCSSSGSCSWFECARAIAAAVTPDVAVDPVGTADYVRPARRPAYSVLDKSRYEAWTGHRMPDWHDGLREYLASIEEHR